jgi:tripartite-type tricarboxylate transporter receptor subunit TctC
MQLPRRQFLHLAASAAALPASASAASAETYPARPIRLVVPFPPGGAFDTLARPWVEKMKPLLGTMVVEDSGGGGSSLGAAAVARARPDGYTILLGGSLPTVNEALLKSRPLYDPFKDLDPIAGLGVVAFALAVHPSVRVKRLEQTHGERRERLSVRQTRTIGVRSSPPSSANRLLRARSERNYPPG